MNNGLYAVPGSSATANAAPRANSLDLPTTKVSNVHFEKSASSPLVEETEAYSPPTHSASSAAAMFGDGEWPERLAGSTNWFIQSGSGCWTVSTGAGVVCCGASFWVLTPRPTETGVPMTCKSLSCISVR